MPRASYCQVVILLTLLFPALMPRVFAAEGAASDMNAATVAQTSDVSKLSKLTLQPATCDPPSYRFRMGTRLFIEATGAYANTIRTATATSAPGSIISLYFDGTRIPGIPVGVSEDDGVRLVMFFDIVRKPDSQQSREAWDSLFKAKSAFDMEFDLSVKIPNSGPLPVGIDLKPTKCSKALVGAPVNTVNTVDTSESEPKFVFYVGSKASILMTAVLCIVAFFCAFLLLSRSNALRDGADGSLYSLGRSQMAFWTLLVFLAFAGVLFINGTMEEIPSQMLQLLGLTGGTGLVAYVIGESQEASRLSQSQVWKSELATLQAIPAPSASEKAHMAELEKKLTPPVSAGFFRDICNDGMGLSFHRMQVVIWTLILGAVFVGSVMQTMSMPEFPGSLLILMGISNITYLGFKIPEKP